MTYKEVKVLADNREGTQQPVTMDPAQAFEASVIARHKPQMDAMDRVIESGDSDILQFYDNAVVFVTGGSGFLGKLLIEKLLRTCNIKKVYMLIRAKKGVPGRDRLEVVFSDPLFETLKKRKPNFLDIIVPVNGDIGELRVGLSDPDWQTMVGDVNNVFHLAATTRFDENLKTSILFNTRGTREVVKFAKDCKELRSFVYVSTAYSNASQTNLDIQDKFYPALADPELLIKMAESFDADIMKDISEGLTKHTTNNYTYSKSLAEDMVRTMTADIPACVVRPGIVISTLWDPVPGWIDPACVYSATGLVVGPGVGLTRVIYFNPESPVGLIPADIVNNVTIAAGWKTGHRAKDDEPKIYTVSTSKNPVTMGILAESVHSVRDKYPTPKSIWYNYCFCVKTKFAYNILAFLLHHVPGYFVDFVCILLGKERRFVKIYKKFDHLSLALGDFGQTMWTFDNSGVERLTHDMSKSDRLLFPMATENIDWTDYIDIWCVGARKYIVKDGLKGTNSAFRKMFFFRIANHLVALLYLYIFYKLLSLVYYVFVKFMYVFTLN